MARTTRGKVQVLNEVMRRLMKGNGSIKGLKMLVAVDDVALCPVEVVGITYSAMGGYGNGINVTVKPVGGSGEMIVPPLSLVDDTPAGRDLFDRKAKAQAIIGKFGAAKSDRQRRDYILQARDQMTPAQKKVFDATAPDHFGEGAEMVKSVNKATGEYALRRVFEKAAKLLYGVEDVDQYDD